MPGSPRRVPRPVPSDAVPRQAAELLQGRCPGTDMQEVLSLPPGPCCLHGWMAFSFGLFCCFPCSGLRAALLGPRQLREVDMFTSKELLLIKHQ